MENKGPYIIVSDVHLGSERCNKRAFCCFLEWVHDLEHLEHLEPPQKIKYKDKDLKDKEFTIESPGTVILLGDIVDLWDPKNGDRDNVIRDSLRPFSLLSDINCDKIYVTGNHDDSFCELNETIETLANSKIFHIYDSYFPKGKEHESSDNVKNINKKMGLKIGKKSYFFLHGHQFDKEQDIIERVSNLIGELWDPLDWFQTLYNIPFTKNHWKINFIILLVLFLGGKLILWKEPLNSSLLNTSVNPSFWTTIVWATITGFFALCSIPGIVAHTQKLIYSFTNPKDKTAKEVITDKYYKNKKDTIKADFVVFGHTHFASSYDPEEDKNHSKKGKKQKPWEKLFFRSGKREAVEKKFINSGCWVGADENIDGKKRYTNTFIYIDETGAYILIWRGFGKIDCIEAFPCDQQVSA